MCAFLHYVLSHLCSAFLIVSLRETMVCRYAYAVPRTVPVLDHVSLHARDSARTQLDHVADSQSCPIFLALGTYLPRQCNAWTESLRPEGWRQSIARALEEASPRATLPALAIRTCRVHLLPVLGLLTPGQVVSRRWQKGTASSISAKEMDARVPVVASQRRSVWRCGATISCAWRRLIERERPLPWNGQR